MTTTVDGISKTLDKESNDTACLDTILESDETTSLSPSSEINTATEINQQDPKVSVLAEQSNDGMKKLNQISTAISSPLGSARTSKQTENTDDKSNTLDSMTLDFECEDMLAEEAFEPFTIITPELETDTMPEKISIAADKEEWGTGGIEAKNQEGNLIKPTSPKLLKAVINCVPQVLPPHVRERLKSDESAQQILQSGSRKRKLSKHLDSNEHKQAEYDWNDKSIQLDKCDKFYDIKRILLYRTREVSGVNTLRFRQFSNIFLKNWRFSKQFSGRTNARGKQVIQNTLEKIVADLFKNQLIRIKGPEDNINVVKMVVGEILRDNSRMFSQTPPSLTILITSELFDRYYSNSVPTGTGKKSGKLVNLGSSAEQWYKLKEELGMEDNGEVAAALIHCYKAWTSVACGKCRRHMEVGMERATGRSVVNSESSVCIVSCGCGKNTSGGFMIECDVCHKWQHGFCVDIDKDSIPESYACMWCRRIRGSVVLEGEEKGDSDDSVVSIDNTELCSTDDSSPEVIELD